MQTQDYGAFVNPEAPSGIIEDLYRTRTTLLLVHLQKGNGNALRSKFSCVGVDGFNPVSSVKF